MEIHSDFGTLVEPERKDVAVNNSSQDSFKRHLEQEDTLSQTEQIDIAESVSDDIYLSLIYQDLSVSLDEKNIQIKEEVVTLLNQAFIQSALAIGQYKTVSHTEFDAVVSPSHSAGQHLQTTAVGSSNVSTRENSVFTSFNDGVRSNSISTHSNAHRNIKGSDALRTENGKQQVLLPFRPIDEYAKVFIKVVEHGKNLKIMYRNYEDLDGVSLKQYLFNSASPASQVPLSLTINGKTEVFNGYPASR
ncbi:hypothetical protein GCE9029_03355 [Grimontia celer]|uniref:Uncharacterized protein n=1 Tax=Grimontia celer TaxID=1796497 RepID=A0A128F778_9GAMM|nr:hypothetical protein [Grimontia celer]CZF82643.1 hypothetical protein GCE9029_03355 [Grimontia celer]